LSDFISLREPVVECIESLGAPRNLQEKHDEDGKLTLFRFEVDCIDNKTATRNGIIYVNAKETWPGMKSRPFLDTHKTESVKHSLGHVHEVGQRPNGERTINTAIVDIDPMESDFIRKVKRGDITAVSIHAVASKARKNDDGAIEATVDHWRELSATTSPGYAESKITGMYAESLAEQNKVHSNNEVKNAIAAREAIKNLKLSEAAALAKSKNKKGEETMKDEELLKKLEEAMKDDPKRSILEGLIEQDFLSGDGDSKGNDGDAGAGDDDAGGDAGKDKDADNKEAAEKIEALEKAIEEKDKTLKGMKEALKERRKPSGLSGKDTQETTTEKVTAGLKKIAPSIYKS